MANSAQQDAQELEWIQRAQSGDHEAFGFLVQRFERRIFALIFRLIGQRDVVEDLAQEVFIKAFRSIGSYSFAASFAGWLSRVAVNHCYDYLRHQRVTQSRITPIDESADARDGPIEVARTHEPDPERQAVLRDLVSKLLDRAPPDDRVVLVLKELEGFSIEEIAKGLHVRESTVKVRLHRARKRMLEDLRRLQGK